MAISAVSKGGGHPEGNAFLSDYDSQRAMWGI